MWLVLSTMTVTGESDKEIKSMAFTPCSFLLLFCKYFFMTTSVNGKLKSVDYDITFPSGVTTDFVHCKRTGNIVDFGFRILSGSIPYGSPLATLPADLHPKYNILIPSQYLVINDVASTGNVSLMYNGSIFQEYSATGTLNACVIKGTFII